MGSLRISEGVQDAMHIIYSCPEKSDLTWTDLVHFLWLVATLALIVCKGTSPIRKRTPLGPYCRPMPRVLGVS